MRKTAIAAGFAVALVASAGAAAGGDNPTKPEPYVLWDPAIRPPAAAEIPLLENVRFSTVKRREPEKDGYDWLHGAAIVRHKGTLFACWGHNKGLENTPTEVNQGRRSDDDGRTWSPVEMIASGAGEDARSHGVFLSHQNTLWVFLARFGNDDEGRKYARLKTEAFVLDEETDRWQCLGPVADAFWPLDEPTQMADGNWITGGLSILAPGRGQPAVAISRGDDLTRWDTVKVPTPKDMVIWGETTVIVEPDEVVAVARGSAHYHYAMASASKDYGRTWSVARESNLPMTATKPFAGTLSTGQRYLIGTTTRDHRHRRDPLTVAVSRPGEKTFCRMWRIRDGVRPDSGDPRSQRLAYPYAVEYDGHLYVIYSAGHLGGNRNNAELAVFPVASLAVN
ncbi:MAG: exo-alpha-sialidase [Planctomycetota bacterium]|jgi:hypothetical protein